MSPEININYVPGERIDRKKWEHCISNAPNERIYAHTYYLDHMAAHWDALVLGDYEAVMPLTWNRKYGLYYLYQPAFTASLGVFGNLSASGLTEAFLSAIPAKFRLAEIALNPANHFSSFPPYAAGCNNYVLDLNRPYTELAAGYRENVRRNIKKSRQLHCECKKDIPLDSIVELSRAAMGPLTNVKQEDYIHFTRLFSLLSAQNQAVTYGVYTPAGELVASCVYFFCGKRAYYILVGNHPNGKTLGASHYLIDCFIRDYAGTDLLLDFEGSDIRNLAFFYGSFGASVETYPFIRINRLPFWLRWMKR